jgi:hypothetical protein
MKDFHIFEKKIINGKTRIIYKKSHSNVKYIRYKNNMIQYKIFKKIQNGGRSQYNTIDINDNNRIDTIVRYIIANQNMIMIQNLIISLGLNVTSNNYGDDTTIYNEYCITNFTYNDIDQFKNLYRNTQHATEFSDNQYLFTTNFHKSLSVRSDTNTLTVYITVQN